MSEAGNGVSEAGNGTRPAASPVFPMTVAELDAVQDEGDGSVRAVDDTGPIEVVVPREDQLDSAT